MRIAILTSQSRSTAALAAPLMASDLGPGSVAVFQIPERAARGTPAGYARGHATAARSMFPSSRNSVLLRVEDAAERSGIQLIHLPTWWAPVAEGALAAWGPDLAVAVQAGALPEPLHALPRWGTVRLGFGSASYEAVETAVLWSIHDGDTSVEFRFDRLTDGPGRLVVHGGRVPIQFRATLEDTLRSTVTALAERSAKTLTNMIGWAERMVPTALPVDLPQAREHPNWWQRRRIGRKHRSLWMDALRQPHTRETVGDV